MTFGYCLQARLDKVAEAGLPIWITELTLSEKDENLKGNQSKPHSPLPLWHVWYGSLSYYICKSIVTVRE